MNRDPGLQPERTGLAWRRTGLSMLVNGALLVRAAVERRSPAMTTVALLVALSSLVMFGIGFHRDRALTRAVAPPAPHAGLLIFLMGAVWLACAAAVLSMPA